MSRYLDRLSPDAALAFKHYVREPYGYLPPGDRYENHLVDLATKLAPLKPCHRTKRLMEIFGEQEAVEASHVLDAILADLDTDAEVAGDPETVEDAPNARFRFYCVEVTNATPAQVDQITQLVAGILGDRS